MKGYELLELFWDWKCKRNNKCNRCNSERANGPLFPTKGEEKKRNGKRNKRAKNQYSQRHILISKLPLREESQRNIE